MKSIKKNNIEFIKEKKCWKQGTGHKMQVKLQNSSKHPTRKHRVPVLTYKKVLNNN